MIKKYFTEIRTVMKFLNETDDIGSLPHLLGQLNMPGIHRNSRDSGYGDDVFLYPENDPPRLFVVLEKGAYFVTVLDDSEREYHWEFRNDNFLVKCEWCGRCSPLVDAEIGFSNDFWLCEHCYYSQTYQERHGFFLTSEHGEYSL